MIAKFILLASLGLTPIQKAQDGEIEEPTVEVVETNEETPEQEQSQEFDWKAWLEQWFSPDQIAMVMSWVAYAGTIIGLVVRLKQLAKSKSTTAEQVKELVLEEIKKSVNEEIANQVKPYLDGVVKVQGNTNEIMQVFAKILVLSQNNDAESKVAILNLIASLGVVDKEVLDQVKESVVEEEKVKEETKSEALNKIDSVIEDTEKEEYDGTSV